MAGTTQYKNDWQKANLDRISLTVPKGQKEQIQGHASTHGESVNGFISRAICEAIERDQTFEQNRDGIISLAQKYHIDMDIDEPEFKKIVEALAVLEPHIPDIKNAYFSKLYQQVHTSDMQVIVIKKDLS